MGSLKDRTGVPSYGWFSAQGTLCQMPPRAEAGLDGLHGVPPLPRLPIVVISQVQTLPHGSQQRALSSLSNDSYCACSTLPGGLGQPVSCSLGICGGRQGRVVVPRPRSSPGRETAGLCIPRLGRSRRPPPHNCSWLCMQEMQQ